MKTIKATYLAVILICVCSALQGCMNEYRALLNGDVAFLEAYNAAPRARINRDDQAGLLRELHQADSIYQITGSKEDYSDLGVLLVYSGNYLRAKSIFLHLQSVSPGLYNTAANLGTTYELLGQNDSALLWIRRAIEINPRSHQGSEWIHVKILEAKIKAAGDGRYLQAHPVLGLDFGNDEIPVNKTGLDPQTLRLHLYDQLRERLSFIDPTDPVMAQLLFDLGNVAAITADVTGSLQIYELARTYGFDSPLLDKREAYFMKLQRKADRRNSREEMFQENPLLYMVISAACLIIFTSGIVIFLKWIKTKRR